MTRYWDSSEVAIVNKIIVFFLPSKVLYKYTHMYPLHMYTTKLHEDYTYITAGTSTLN